MRQKSGPEKQPAEDAIRDIRRATRRHRPLGGEGSVGPLHFREPAIRLSGILTML
jgi:hypothetical protein